jgi:shikimate kinase
MDNLYIIGFMGSGKSSLSLELDKINSRKLISTDELIENRIGMSISDIFDRYGEAFFRKQEHMLLCDISKNDGQIIDCGGGLPLNPLNRELIKASGRCIYLKVSPETVILRLEKDESRPLLRNKKSIKEISLMLNERVKIYESIADISIDSNKLSTEEIAEKLIPYL